MIIDRSAAKAKWLPIDTIYADPRRWVLLLVRQPGQYLYAVGACVCISGITGQRFFDYAEMGNEDCVIGWRPIPSANELDPVVLADMERNEP